MKNNTALNQLKFWIPFTDLSKLATHCIMLGLFDVAALASKVMSDFSWVFEEDKEEQFVVEVVLDFDGGVIRCAAIDISSKEDK